MPAEAPSYATELHMYQKLPHKAAEINVIMNEWMNVRKDEWMTFILKFDIYLDKTSQMTDNISTEITPNSHKGCFDLTYTSWWDTPL